MKYKVNDRVKMRSLQWCKENIFNNEDKYPPELFNGIEKFCGKILTISDAVDKSKYVDEGYYNMFEDTKWDYYWTDEMIEGLVEEEFEVDLIPKFGEYSDNEPLDIPTMTTEFVKEHGLPCPEGYIFKDENGNVINATKIVLEKKKKEYPKTYEECCRVVNANSCIRLVYNLSDGQKYYHDEDNLYLYENFRRLKICRDAYWTIYGEENGLGKPWEPTMETVYCISRNNNVMKCSYRGGKSNILEFPTAEMRDAFYENFKELIEFCKEFL